MYTTASSANCVLEQPFSEVFQVTPYYTGYQRSGGRTCNIYLVTCTRTKQYRYVGMTKTAASTAFAAKVSKYRRRNPAYDFSQEISLNAGGHVVPSTVLGAFETSADVQYEREGGDMCGVSIRVAETINCYTTDAVTPLPSMDETYLRGCVNYAVGGARDYDDADA